MGAGRCSAASPRCGECSTPWYSTTRHRVRQAVILALRELVRGLVGSLVYRSAGDCWYALRTRPAARPGPSATRGFVQSLQRGLAVIRAFDAENPALTLSDVAKATELAPATARRFVLTLVDLGYMRAEGRWFRLSPRVLELGRPYLASLTLPEIARPHLREFVADVRESSSIAILDGSDIVYIAHEAAKRLMSVQVTVGTRDPAFATSLGRVLIAGADDDCAGRVARHAAADARSRRRRSPTPTRCSPSCGGSARRASRSSTRSSRRDCARSRRRSTTSTATSSPRSTSPCTRAGGRSRRSTTTCCRGSCAQRRRSMPTCATRPPPAPSARAVPVAAAAACRGAAGRRRSRDRLRAVAAARARGDPRVRRREPGAHAERRRQDHRPRARGRAPVRADARRARLHARRRAALPAEPARARARASLPHDADAAGDRGAAPARLRRGRAGVVVGRDARRERHPVRGARLGEADHVRVGPVGTRDPAFATSLGRALLAGRSDAALAAMLDGVQLARITDVDDRRAERAARRAAGDPRAGLRARRSGAGGGTARARGAAARRARRGDRVRQRRRTREPLVDRADPSASCFRDCSRPPLRSRSTSGRSVSRPPSRWRSHERLAAPAARLRSRARPGRRGRRSRDAR